MTSNRLQRSVFGRNRAARDTIISAMSSKPATAKASRRMADCCSHGRLYLDGYPPTARLWVHRCGHRLCPICARYRSRRVAEQVRGAMRRISAPRHITLTIQTFPGGRLARAIRHVRESFARLRRNPDWTSRVQGGIYCVEVSRNESDGRWHPHLHIITTGEYYPQQLLSAGWEVATRGSMVVWINAARPSHADYLAKYVGKPADIAAWPADAIAEYAEATRGARMVQTFGTLHGEPLVDRDEPPEPPEHRYVIPLSRLRLAASNGDPGALALSRALAVRWHALAVWAVDLVDLPPPGGIPGADISPREAAQMEVDRLAKFVLKYAEPVGKKTRGIQVVNSVSTGSGVQGNATGKLWSEAGSGVRS